MKEGLSPWQHALSVNLPPAAPTRDVILEEFGTSDLGPVNWQLLCATSTGIFGAENAN